jgi:hypothetical protein
MIDALDGPCRTRRRKVLASAAAVARQGADATAYDARRSWALDLCVVSQPQGVPHPGAVAVAPVLEGLAYGMTQKP